MIINFILIAHSQDTAEIEQVWSTFWNWMCLKKLTLFSGQNFNNNTINNYTKIMYIF